MKAPGTKRLSVALSAVAYVLIGVPVWWYTTSLHRPPLPHDDIAAAAATAQDRSALLPLSLRLVVAVPEGADLSASLLPLNILKSLQEAVSAHSSIEAPIRLTATVNVAGHCSSSTTTGTDPAESGSCINLSAAASSFSGNGNGGSSSIQQQARQLDDWLGQYSQQQGVPKNTGVPTAAAGVPGQYTLFILPLKAAAVAAAAAAAEQQMTSDGSSNRSAATAPQLLIGRYSHGWTTYSEDQASQQPQQLIQLATAAAVQALICCFGLHSSRTAIAAAETLPISASSRTQLSFSLLNADPTITDRYMWDFDRFEQQYLSKVIASLVSITQITSTSQILHHTPARTAGKWSQKHDAYVVRHSQLPSFIDSEWAIESGGGGLAQHSTAAATDQGSRTAVHVSSSAPSSTRSHAAAAAAGYGDDHTKGLTNADKSAVLESHVLHFLVYIPPPDRRPLLLLGPKGKVQDSNSFWIPSWGGLVVLNPLTKPTPETGSTNDTDDNSSSSSENSSSSSSSNTADHSINAASYNSSSSSWAPPIKLNDQQYQYIAAVVLAQLQALLGVAPTYSTLSSSGDDELAAMISSKHQRFAVQQLPAGTAGFSAWQIDGLARQRTAFDMAESSRVLASLSKLVQELPNLEMPDLIGQQVSTALQDLKSAWQHITAGEYLPAAAAAAAARSAAEAAFLHPAVLAQLNFPDSHKLGVYMPLFLPISVPLVQGLVVQMSRCVSRRRSVRAAAVAAAP